MCSLGLSDRSLHICRLPVYELICQKSIRFMAVGTGGGGQGGGGGIFSKLPAQKIQDCKNSDI